LGTKVHFVTDGAGTPLAALLSPAQQHDATLFVDVIEAARMRRTGRRSHELPSCLVADKGYDSDPLRTWTRRRHMQPVIPRRSHSGATRPNPDFDREAYRGRNVVERCTSWLKECRRVLTRFEKLAVNYLAMVGLAMIQRYLRMLFSDRP
jgi:transposase